MKHRKHRLLMLYSMVLAAFTAYFLLDTFVIARVYAVEGTSAAQSQTAESTGVIQAAGTKDDTAGQSDQQGAVSGQGGTGSSDSQSGSSKQSGSSSSDDQSSSSKQNGSNSSGTKGGTTNSAIAKSTTPVVTENSYTDENISINIKEYEAADTVIYVADVQLSSAEYLKTALAQGLFGRNVTEKTSATAKNAGAILAINGDYYGSQQKGYVIRNGVLYRSTSAGREDLVIYSDGSFGIITEGQISAEQLLKDGAVQVLSFGPALVEDGQISVGVSTEVGKAMASNPRTAIGIIDECHYIFVVSDGRTSESEGLSLYELAQVMQQLGAKTAYNLDGGGSSTMYFNGSVVNNPTTNGRTISERSVSDIVYIGY